MYNHEPKGYSCPFCKIVLGNEQGVHTKQADIIYRDTYCTAFMASHPLPKTDGYIIVAPNQHIEHLYDMSDKLLSKISLLSKKLAIVLKKEFKCGGINIRQHNGPEYGQDIYHYHLHVIPRYKGDNIYHYVEHGTRRILKSEIRKKYALRLKKQFKKLYGVTTL